MLGSQNPEGHLQLPNHPHQQLLDACFPLLLPPFAVPLVGLPVLLGWLGVDPRASRCTLVLLEPGWTLGLPCGALAQGGAAAAGRLPPASALRTGSTSSSRVQRCLWRLTFVLPWVTCIQTQQGGDGGDWLEGEGAGLGGGMGRCCAVGDCYGVAHAGWYACRSNPLCIQFFC
jgi:hypothetical protein